MMFNRDENTAMKIDVALIHRETIAEVVAEMHRLSVDGYRRVECPEPTEKGWRIVMIIPPANGRDASYCEIARNRKTKPTGNHTDTHGNGCPND